jgi:uncharacterized membrane protein
MNDNYMVFYPDKKRLGFLSLFITFVVCTFAGALLLFRLFSVAIPEGSDIFTFITISLAIIVLVIALVLILIVLLSLPSMHYELGDDALYLIIGPWSDRVPYNEIIDITVKDLVLNPLASFRMPGLALFNVRYSDEGTVRMYSTHSLNDVVLIKTLKKKYGISPKDENGFIAALQSKIKNHGVVKVKTSEEGGLIGKESQTKRFSVVEIIVWLIVVASFIVGIYFYYRLPQRIAVHWNASGNVNGYLPKFLGIFLSPFLFTLLSLLPTIIPKGSSQESYKKFRFKYYLVMLVVFSVLFFAYIYMLLWNIGVKMNFNIFFPILITGIVISIIVQLILFRRIGVPKK